MNKRENAGKGRIDMQTVAFGYKCQECGQGTVLEKVVPEYKTKLKGSFGGSFDIQLENGDQTRMTLKGTHPSTKRAQSSFSGITTGNRRRKREIN
jgi:hypothetical protein